VTETKPGPSEAYYAALADDDPDDLYEHAPCGYLSTLPDGTIIKVNQTLLDWTGFTREELVGQRRFADLLTVGGRIYHETHYAPLLAMHGSAREIAVDVRCADGERLPVLVNAVLLRDPDGAPRVIRTSIFDATDRRSYERELLRARERAEASEERARVLAQTLQQSLIPPSPPTIPGLLLAAAYRPAGDGGEVGGDFYDVFETGDGNWVVVLGDVCGKGAEAATVTALLRYTIRAAAMREPSPSAMLAIVNEALLRHATDRFCTAIVLRLTVERESVRVVMASGGHALPLQVDAAGVRSVGHPGSLLGVLDDPDLRDATLTLLPGERLFCCTDGIAEGRRGDRFFGEARLEQALLAAGDEPAEDVPRAIVEEVVAFQGGMPRDDIAAVLLEVPIGPREDEPGRERRGAS
jgi:phosphoserine phosphatase RsbU/P